MPQDGVQLEPSRRLIERIQCFCIISVEFK
jgi:pilus assembly protein CpaF